MVKHFLKKYNAKAGKRVEIVSQDTMGKLQNYSWPGNVRELENIIERAVITSKSNKLVLGDWLSLQTDLIQTEHEILPLEEMERNYIKEVLEITEWKVSGEKGAARIYGPQKGATAEMVEELEKNLLHLSRVVEQQLGRDINNIAGAGAAGGLSAGAVAFMNAAIVSGIDSVIEFSGLKDEMENADWIITGEGSFDSQSLDGKVVSGIAKQASETGCKVAVIAGTVEVKREVYQKHGIAEALGCKKEEMSLEYALRNAESLLESAVAEFVKRLGEWL